MEKERKGRQQAEEKNIELTRKTEVTTGEGEGRRREEEGEGRGEERREGVSTACNGVSVDVCLAQGWGATRRTRFLLS